MATWTNSGKQGPPKESLPCQAWVCSDTPTVTVCQTKESPVKSSSTSRQQNAAVNIEVCWKPGQAASRFPETLKKKTAQLHANSWGEQALCTACIGIAALKDFTKDSQWTRSQRHSFTSCNRLPIGSQSLRSLLLLAGSLQFHVDLTFRLRFGIRKSMHQLEAMPQSGPCMQLLWYISFVYYLIIYI